MVGRQVQLITTRDDSVILEMPDSQGSSRRRGRPVVYLDQNHWSTLSAALYRPEAVRAHDLAAARSLVGLALRDKVILPISFGHLSETCQWQDAEKRYQLALTLAQFSRGWQLRDPLHVRELELRSAIAQFSGLECVLPIDAITLAPDAICSGRETALPAFADVSDIPFEMQASLAYLRSSSGTFDTLFDAEAEPRGSNPGWVERNKRFQVWLRANTSQAQQRRKATREFFLHDTSGELADAVARTGVSAQQLAEWLAGPAVADLAAMPALGLYGEALHDQSVNATGSWEDNDLTDLFYLSCAAGYADYVACEREAAGVLRQGVQRLKRTSSVHNSLSDLIAALQAT